MIDDIDPAITPITIISRFMNSQPMESPVQIGEACALVERTSEVWHSKYGSPFKVLSYNVAVGLADLKLGADVIAAAILYPLLPIVDSTTTKSIERVLNVNTNSSSESLLQKLLRFSRLEWNSWPTPQTAYLADTSDEAEAQEALRKSYLFAVGPVTEVDKQNVFFVETASRNREKQVTNLLNLLETASDDWHVPIIKLFERISLTRMLNRADLSRGIHIDKIAFARINLAIYAVLAERQQGAWILKSALEDASLLLLDPVGYREIQQILNADRMSSGAQIDKTVTAIKECLAERGILDVEVYGRRKHVFSIYRKLKTKHLSPDKINDLLGVRIVGHPITDAGHTEWQQRVDEAKSAWEEAKNRLKIIEEDPNPRSKEVQRQRRRAIAAVREASNLYSRERQLLSAFAEENEKQAVKRCYDIFAALRDKWSVVGDFYDGDAMRNWIPHPKANGYQSIHTTLLVNGMIVEVQIRSWEMHQNAEFGLASHQGYKSEKNYGGIQPVEQTE